MTKQNSKKFYKYRVADLNNIQALHDTKIYLSDPKEFNDPFDCVVRLIRDYPKYFAISDQKCMQMIKEFEKENPQLEFTEPAHKIKMGYNEILKDIAKLRIYCVSEKNDDLLMWTHYADGLRGFCIEFDSKADFLRYAAKVHYKNNLPNASDAIKKLLEIDMAYFKNNENTVMEKFKKLIDIAILSKLKHFCYEKEWRIADRRKDLLSYKPLDVSNIIFGELMKDEQKNLIKTILKDKYPHIKNTKIARIKGDQIVVE